MSTADDIAAGVAAVVTGLALPGVVVVARKFPARVEGDPDAVVSVSVAEDRFEPATGEDDFAGWGFYRVLVVVARKSPLTLGDAADVRGWRQSIRRALWRPSLTGVAAVDDVTPLPTPEFDAGLLDAAAVDYSPLAFEYRTAEPRT